MALSTGLCPFAEHDGRNPVGVGVSVRNFPQGSSRLATLGFEAESLWDSTGERADTAGAGAQKMLQPKGRCGHRAEVAPSPQSQRDCALQPSNRVREATLGEPRHGVPTPTGLRPFAEHDGRLAGCEEATNPFVTYSVVDINTYQVLPFAA